MESVFLIHAGKVDLMVLFAVESCCEARIAVGSHINLSLSNEL